MAGYTASTLDCMITGMNGGPAQWFYSSVDAHTDVDATGYFTDGDDRGMKLNDAMCVVDTNSGSITWHRVLSGGLSIGASGA